MSLAEIMHSIQSLPPLIAFRESALVYPITMATHLASIAAFGGLILMTDLRLLGVAFTEYYVTDVVKGLRPWKHAGLTIILICGILLGSSEADKYYPNGFFWTKMTLLILAGVHALVFKRSVYRNTEALDRAQTVLPQARLAAATSLVLWTSIACMGRLIAYWE